jgi:hypothetical protein
LRLRYQVRNRKSSRTPGWKTRAAADVRGALDTLERAAQSGRAATISGYLLRDVELMDIRALTSRARKRQGELKRCALTEIARGPNASPMSFDDRTADR